MDWIECKNQRPEFDTPVLVPVWYETELYRVDTGKLISVETKKDKDGERTWYTFYLIGDSMEVCSDFWMPQPLSPISITEN